MAGDEEQMKIMPPPVGWGGVVQVPVKDYLIQRDECNELLRSVCDDIEHRQNTLTIKFVVR